MLEWLKTWLSRLWDFVADQALPAVLILAVGLWVIRLTMKLIDKTLAKTKVEKSAHKLLKTVTRTGLSILLALIVASRVGIDVSGIVALASVLTLAISLSVQDALTNLIGGFTLLNTKPFVADDFVEIAGQSGTVREIGLAYTKLVTADNKLIFIPNSSVVSSQIVNYTTTGTRRVTIQVSASYDAPVEKVLSALLEAAKVPTVLNEPEVAACVEKYGDHAIEYTLRVWCKTDAYWTTHYAVTENVKKVFDDQGISMTYPHLNVHLDK